MMLRSETIGHIAAALAAAQGVMEDPLKDRRVSAGPRQYAYAQLPAVLQAARGPLSAAKIALIQAPSVDGALVTVQTMLLHESGEYLGCELSARVSDAGPQAIGSAITYLRRYGLLALLGLAADDDDDGMDAERREGRIEPVRPPAPAPAPKAPAPAPAPAPKAPAPAPAPAPKAPAPAAAQPPAPAGGGGAAASAEHAAALAMARGELEMLLRPHGRLRPDWRMLLDQPSQLAVRGLAALPAAGLDAWVGKIRALSADDLLERARPLLEEVYHG